MYVFVSNQENIEHRNIILRRNTDSHNSYTRE